MKIAKKSVEPVTPRNRPQKKVNLVIINRTGKTKGPCASFECHSPPPSCVQGHPPRFPRVCSALLSSSDTKRETLAIPLLLKLAIWHCS